MFSDKSLLKLYLPILVEQLLTTIVGIVSTIMVSRVGSYAVSAVSLVDSINIVVINVFISVATGSTVIITHYLGGNDIASAQKSAKQGILMVFLLSLITSLTLFIFKNYLIEFLFGSIDEDILRNINTYIKGSMVSYPFFALFSVCAGIMRGSNDSASPMFISMAVNIVNVVVGFILISVFGLGVLGAACALVLARMTGAVLALFRIKKSVVKVKFTINDIYLDKKVLFPIFKIALPIAIDGIIYNGSKLLVQTFVVGMGSIAIAGNAVAWSILSFLTIPAMAMVTMTTTVIGQCYGMNDLGKTKYYSLKLMSWSMIMQTALSVLVFPALDFFIGLYKPIPEVSALAKQVLIITLFVMPFIWASSFQLPQSLRAIKDVKYTTIVSVSSMWFVRVWGAWLLGVYFGIGIMGVWIMMYVDWLIRSAFFLTRVLIKKPVSPTAAL